MQFSPGSLVNVRDREWVVMPSEDRNLLLIKPLGGGDDEITGIYLPLRFYEDNVKTAEFPYPTKEDIGDLNTAQILYDAARLSFRNGAGPFRSLAKLSFRPRAYQMVPLIMALRLGLVRLLVADDVGVGKTIEALLIIRELLERRIIKRFAVVCLPHLCEQWKAEIKDKLDLDAVIIRSNTQARLDRDIQDDTSVYEYYPFQVISIDYIKTDTRRSVFIEQCPEMIIVDEAHTCARPAGALASQQQRYHLISRISKKPDQHLVLLTATPHSGKPEEFNSLLGLLKPEFESLDLPNATQKERRRLAAYFVQRRRANVEKWMGENTPFPKRDSGEFDYELSPDYLRFFDDILEFARKIISGDATSIRQKRVHYWTALALMRGAMSSPAAGVEMLTNRLKKLDLMDEDLELLDRNPVLDNDFGLENDFTPGQLVERTDWSDYQKQKIRELSKRLACFADLKHDQKAAYAEMIIDDWLNSGYNPVVFCRYIATAKYLGQILGPVLSKRHKGLELQVVTSEDPDEVRRARVEGMRKAKKRALIATDCLSEGVNLQDYFTAVLHYDLPWNPNRLEQREGRVDRFGQTAKKVKAYMLYGRDNPIDGVVLEVILKKVREIRKSIGISIPFPEESQTILDTVLHSVLLNPKRIQEHRPPKARQLELFGFEDEKSIEQKKLGVSRMMDEAARREQVSRSMFAQHTIKAEEIEQDLKEVDEAIGEPKAVEAFVTNTLSSIIGAQISKDRKGYKLYKTNLPDVMKGILPDGDVVKVSFESPTPDGYVYLGRNHLFVEQLCQYVMANSLNHGKHGAARAAVIRCREVDVKTTILLFRVRNVIEEKRGHHQLVAEEMLLWGYRGFPDQRIFLDSKEAKSLLQSARISSNLTPQARTSFLENELKLLPTLVEEFDKVAEQRAVKLVEAHERFSRLMDKKKFQVVYPVLPIDILGIYILLPDHA